MAETTGSKNYFFNLDTALQPEVEPLQRVTNSRNGLSGLVELCIDTCGVNREISNGFSKGFQPRAGAERRNQTNPISTDTVLLKLSEQS